MGTSCSSSTLLTSARYYGWGVFDAGVMLYPGTVVSVSNCVISPQVSPRL